MWACNAFLVRLQEWSHSSYIGDELKREKYLSLAFGFLIFFVKREMFEPLPTRLANRGAPPAPHPPLLRGNASRGPVSIPTRSFLEELGAALSQLAVRLHEAI